MTFDLIIPDSLWAVRYDGDEENAFYQAFEQWSDPIWLRDFFFQNKNDLNEHFKITNIDWDVHWQTHIYLTIIEYLIMN